MTVLGIKARLVSESLTARIMNLVKLALFLCPVILASLVLVNHPAQASELTTLSHPDAVGSAIAHHGVPVAVTARADQPLIPTGCSCARCAKAEELLRGQFPVV